MHIFACNFIGFSVIHRNLHAIFNHEIQILRLSHYTKIIKFYIYFLKNMLNLCILFIFI